MTSQFNRWDRAAATLTATILSCGTLAFGNQPTRSAPSTVQPASKVDAQTVTKSALREKAIDLLIQNATAEDPRLRANALEALVRVPQRLQPQAAAALKDTSAAVRAVAAMAIGKAKLKELAESVRPLLRDPSSYVRAAAIMGLTKLGESPDPSPLADMLISDDSVKLRSHAAYVLGELGNASASSLLRDAARQPVPRGQEAEWRLLGLQLAEARAKLGETGQLEIIRAALYPGSPQDLEATVLATQILGQLRDKYSRDSLLWMIEGTKEIGPSTAPPELRLTAGHALARMGLAKGAADLAREYANDASPVIRAQVAAVLADAGSVTDLPGLESWVKGQPGVVGLAAADAIIAIIDREEPGR